MKFNPLNFALVILIISSFLYAGEIKWTRHDQFLNPSGIESSGPNNIDLGDINGDGFADLVIVNRTEIQLYQNTGRTDQISFQRQLAWETGFKDLEAYYFRIPTLADLNADGRCDLILVDVRRGTVLYTENRLKDRQITFSVLDTLLIYKFTLNYFAVADLDGDGDLDGITSNRIFWNTGTAQKFEFGVKTQSFKYRSECARFVDYNHDNQPDLLLTYDIPISASGVKLGINKSSGDSIIFEFAPGKDLFTSKCGLSMGIGDLDQDGQFDIVCGNGNPHIEYCKFNPHTNGFQLVETWGKPYGFFESTIAIDDLDMDNNLDLLIVHTSEPECYWAGLITFSLFNNRYPAPGYYKTWLASIPEIEEDRLVHPTLQIIDINRDQRPDFVMSAKKAPVDYQPGDSVSDKSKSRLYHFQKNQYSYYENNTDLFSQFANDSIYYDPHLLDINGDGKDDLFIQQAGVYHFFENTGSRERPVWEERNHWLTGFNSKMHYRAAAGDLNQDGLMDIVFGESDGTLTFFKNTGSSPLPAWCEDSMMFAGIKFTTSLSPTLFDLDNDSDLDLLLCDAKGEIYFYRNDFRTDIGHSSNSISKTEQLPGIQSFPNPFNNATRILFYLPVAGPTCIRIFDIRGQEVAQLINENLPVGSHKITWQTANLASGIYFCRLESGTICLTKKLIFQK